jgi:K+-sensing histidine kinase KdpD
MRDDARFDSAFGLFLGAVLPIAVAGLLVGVRGEIVNANVALVLVLVVVLAAVVGGWRAGALAAVMSALSFDLLHTRPYLRLTIASDDDVETTILLLIVGLSVGFLASRARAARQAAAAGQTEVRRIHRVAELAARGAAAEDMLLAAQDELTAALALRRCRFEAPPFEVLLPRVERNGTVTGTVDRHFARGELELPREGVELPVLARGQPIGRFVLEPTPGVGVSLEQRVVAIAIADQVGAVLASPQGEERRNG